MDQQFEEGLTVEEIREVLLHATVYCCVPLAVDAFRAAQEVLKEVLQDPGQQA